MTKTIRPTRETLATLTLGDDIRVRVGTSSRFQSFSVSFICENFIGLTGPRGGAKNLVPSICGDAVQMTDFNGKRDWVSELVVA